MDLMLNWSSNEWQPGTDVARLGNVIRDHPGRFPALKNVVQGYKLGFSAFGDLPPGCSQPRRRMAAALTRAARALREVGVTFVDGNGCVWPEEWDVEEPAAETSV